MWRRQSKTQRNSEEEIQAIASLLRNAKPGDLSGFFKNHQRGGYWNHKFEDDLQSYVGCGAVRTCTNGTSALHLALMLSKVNRGNFIAVPPLTFSATATSVLMRGCIPYFVDVDPDTWAMDPKKLEEASSEEMITGAIPVHLLGVPAPMNHINNVATKYDMTVIEDNAQALGARYREARTGAWGHYATCSFQDTKVLSTLGEGGAVFVNTDKADVEKLEALRNHGQQYFNVDETCWNYRMTEAQALSGVHQLKRLDEWNGNQRTYRALAMEALEPFGFIFQKEPHETTSTFYIIGTAHEDSEYRQKVYELLRSTGWSEPVPGRVVSLGYARTIMDLPLLLKYKRECPVSEWLVRHFLWFDIARGWETEDEVKSRLRDIVRLVRSVK